MAPIAGEAVDMRIAIAVGNEDVAIRRCGDRRRMVERRAEARPLRVPEAKPNFPVGPEGEDPVIVPIHRENAPIGRDGDAVSVRDRLAPPLLEQFAFGAKNEDDRLSSHQDIGAPNGIDRDIGGEAELAPNRHACPRPLHEVAPLPETDDPPFRCRRHGRLLADSYSLRLTTRIMDFSPLSISGRIRRR
jgi:hypothetical protein